MRNTVLAAGFSCVLTLAGAEHTHAGPASTAPLGAHLIVVLGPREVWRQGESLGSKWKRARSA